MRLVIALALALSVMTTPAAASRRVSITTPAPGDAVAAHPHVASLSAQLSLRGRAARRSVVELRVRCELALCRTTTVADRRGRWKALLDVVLPRGRSHVRIHGRYAGEADGYARPYALELPGYAFAPPYSDDAPAPQLAMIGDSLAVGTDSPLRADLPGWKVTTDARVSRPLSVGMALLDMTPIPPRPLALAFSLFTNDDPRGVDALEAAVRRSLGRLRASDCAIWATILRPRVGGVSYRAANQRLKALARDPLLSGQLVVVDWEAAVRRHPERVSNDDVHPTAEGYAARARLYARAAQSCAADHGW